MRVLGASLATTATGRNVNTAFPKFLTTLLLAATAAAAQAADEQTCSAAETQALAAKVEAHYQGAQSIRARFVQHSHDLAFPGETRRAEGTVLFAKPGRMRWQYTAPQASLVISDGITLWLVDSAAKEVQVLPVAEAFASGVALQFLLGDARLAEHFNLKARGCNGALAALQLQPRKPASYAELELHVAPATGELRGTRMADLLGNRSELEFRAAELNVEAQAADFTYRPGPDERVLHLQPPNEAPR